jgi:hypothetical protein
LLLVQHKNIPKKDDPADPVRPGHLTLLSAMAPAKDLFLESRSETDLLIFSFVTGLITPNHSELQKAAAAGKSIYMLYPLPAAWSRPSHWAPLGDITLKAEAGKIILYFWEV